MRFLKHDDSFLRLRFLSESNVEVHRDLALGFLGTLDCLEMLKEGSGV